MKLFAEEMESEIQKSIPIYLNLVHKLKLNFKNEIYNKINFNQIPNIIQEMEMYEGSPVLEYLMDTQNIDNVQVFLSDFMEMLIDLSLDQNNVLFCGHS